MMARISALLFAPALSVLLLSSCGTNHQNTALTSTLDKARSRLESEQTVARSDPFAVREFDPHPDGKWIGQAVSYGCYREGQAPGQAGPSAEEILEDLNIIVQHWNLIRVYNADDDTQRILEVIQANRLPLQVMLGIWLEGEDGRPAAKASNINNVLRGIELANRFPGIVAAVNVGNETQVFWSGHKLDQDLLIKYIRIVREYTAVPITTADDYNFWNKAESAVVADELDFLVTHIYPLWNGKTLDTAIPWLDDTFRQLQQIHPHKQLVLGEIGWATNYNVDKKGDGEQGTLIKGEVGVPAQSRFLLELDAWINENKVTTFLFEAFDEPWKGGGESSGPNEIEKNWGVFHVDRTPKPSFSNYLINKQLRN
jgi:exo-beta-1,3-glucanase (GH17 family)